MPPDKRLQLAGARAGERPCGPKRWPASRRTFVHRRLGRLGFCLVPLTVASGLATDLGRRRGSFVKATRASETGFETRGGPCEVSIAWSAITEAVETEAVLLLFTGRRMAQVVPRGAIAAAGQLDAVRGILQERHRERAHLLRASEEPAAGTA
ncbi:MAG: YcxB family protein [Gemmatimonadales bacterium]